MSRLIPLDRSPASGGKDDDAGNWKKRSGFIANNTNDIATGIIRVAGSGIELTGPKKRASLQFVRGNRRIDFKVDAWLVSLDKLFGRSIEVSEVGV